MWLSLTKPDVFDPSAAHRFPAILDPGFNESFLASPQHLRDWCHVNEVELPEADSVVVRVYEKAVTPRDANLWLYRNVPFSHDEVLGDAPFQIEIDAGILVSPEAKKPRLPLLGLRAIESSKMRVVIDGAQQLVSINSSE